MGLGAGAGPRPRLMIVDGPDFAKKEGRSDRGRSGMDDLCLFVENRVCIAVVGLLRKRPCFSRWRWGLPKSLLHLYVLSAHDDI